MQTHEDIIEIMRKTQELFKNDPDEVQKFWVKYTDKMDKLCEEAFRLNVKWSLQELGKALVGDGKSGPNPVFRVKVVLQTAFGSGPSLSGLSGGSGTRAGDGGGSGGRDGVGRASEGASEKIDFAPSLHKLLEMTTSIQNALIECLVGLNRLPDLLTKRRISKPVSFRVL